MKRIASFSINDEVIQFSSNEKPQPGQILIASTLLKDVNFKKTAILVCAHDKRGSFGLVLNRSLAILLPSIISDVKGWTAPLFQGGPVQPEMLHFIHRRADINIGSIKINENLYWGGDFEKINTLIENGVVTPNEFRFFIGYVGWNYGQLNGEVEQKSWYIAPYQEDYIFPKHHETLWGDIVNAMGPKYQMLLNYPGDLSVN